MTGILKGDASRRVSPTARMTTICYGLVNKDESVTDGKEHAKIKTKQQKQKCRNISLIFLWASLVARMVKNLIAMQETWVEMVTFRTISPILCHLF